jgi:hypothetical protein
LQYFSGDLRVISLQLNILAKKYRGVPPTRGSPCQPTFPPAATSKPTASRNLKIEPLPHEVVRSSASSSDGLDLAEPGTTVDINPATDSTPDGGSD